MMTLAWVALCFCRSLILVPEHGSSVPLQHHLVTTAANQGAFLTRTRESLLDVFFCLDAISLSSSGWCLSSVSLLVKGGLGDLRTRTRATREFRRFFFASLLAQLLRKYILVHVLVLQIYHYFPRSSDQSCSCKAAIDEDVRVSKTY